MTKKIPSSWHHTLALSLLILLIFIIYSNTFNAGWHLDDNTNILNRDAIHLASLDWTSLKKTLFFDNGSRLYRPVVCFTLAVNWYFGQDNTVGYHWLNILIHCSTACFLYLFLHQVLSLPRFRSQPVTSVQFVALLAAALWAINPMQTQAVTYIVQRMASMAAMFYIMSMYFFIRFRTTNQLKNRLIFLAACTVTAFLAFGSKENTWILPAALLLVEFLIVRNPQEINLTKRTFFGMVAAAAIIMTLLVLYLGSNPALFKGYENRAFTLNQRLLTQSRVVTFYLSQLFYPVADRFSIAHDFPLSTSLLSPVSTALSILFLASLLLIGVLLIRKQPLTAFAIFFFFLNHLIESTFLPLELVFEHRNYLPSLFLFVPLSLFLSGTLAGRRPATMVRVSLYLLVPCLLIAVGHSTYLRNAAWKTEASLWTNAIERAPGIWRPWQSLGHDYAIRSRHREAIALFRTALKKRTTVNKNDKYLTHYSLGNQYYRLKNYSLALLHYDQAGRINPNFTGALNNRAAVMVNLGRIPEAIHLFFLSAKKDPPGRPMALSNLGYLLLKDNRTQEALVYLEAAQAEKPQDPLTLVRLGYAYEQNGELGKAMLSFQKASAIEPRNLITRLYIADVYDQAGMHIQKERTMASFIEAVTVRDLAELLREKASADAKYQSVLLEGVRLRQLLCDALRSKHGFIPDIPCLEAALH